MKENGIDNDTQRKRTHQQAMCTQSTMESRLCSRESEDVNILL